MVILVTKWPPSRRYGRRWCRCEEGEVDRAWPAADVSRVAQSEDCNQDIGVVAWSPITLQRSNADTKLVEVPVDDRALGVTE